MSTPALNKNLRVAIYSGNIPSNTFIEHTIRNLAEKGLEIVLIGRVTKKVQYPANVKVIHAPGSFLPALLFGTRQFLRLVFRNASYGMQLLRICISGGKTRLDMARKMGLLFSLVNAKVNVLHLQWGKTIETTPEIFRLRDTKIVLSFRGTHINISPLADEKLSATYRKYFPQIDGFHAVSKAIMEEGVRYGADPEKTQVIYTSIGSSGTPFEAKSESSGTLQIVSVGRHHWVKGYTYAFDALHILRQRNIPFHYTLIAEGELPEELVYQINDQGLASDITVIPGMAHAALMQSLAKYDVFLLPSVGEGIANVVLEAMLAGLPVVCTDCGGMAEVIRDKVNGFLVAPYSGEKLADAIQLLTAMDTHALQEMQAAAKDTLNRFSPEIQANAFLSFYNSLAAA